MQIHPFLAGALVVNSKQPGFNSKNWATIVSKEADRFFPKELSSASWNCPTTDWSLFVKYTICINWESGCDIFNRTCFVAYYKRWNQNQTTVIGLVGGVLFWLSCYERWSCFPGVCSLFLPFPWLVLVSWKTLQREWNQRRKKILALTEELLRAERSQEKGDGDMREHEGKRASYGLSWDCILSWKVTTTCKRERTNDQYNTTEIAFVGQRLKQMSTTSTWIGKCKGIATEKNASF